MEKTYIVKVLAKKDVKINYQKILKLTSEQLQEQGITEPKVSLRFKWYRPSIEVFDSIYTSAVWGTKVGFKHEDSFFPGVKLEDVVSFKALYKAVMNSFTKVSNAVEEDSDSQGEATDYINLLLNLLTEIIKAGFIRPQFYHENLDNPHVLSFISWILAGACAGVGRWFGYIFLNKELGITFVERLYLYYQELTNENSFESISTYMEIMDDFVMYLEDSSYLVDEFSE
ncbi:hypothetical protein SSYRP_v1c07320 [Spiroplasma syrphidicola EA-1]|uniref:Uncharacterized protein n=1 Tax=Spiroplasma syrphidicola EA-1 TaxID=1276229 RepID=R4U4C4_9MOLU|nr:hypothetical protein [Spiroplasma syrphidicola]AGM26322.1 hypothetical protein SSYRP_v1c07320 [Spiroplasma syrphidicola EA-1]